MIGIERDMLNAVAKALHSKDEAFYWKRANMAIKRAKQTFSDEPVVNVYLHGHLIAHIWADGWTWTLAGWNTKTTRSRINALTNYLGGLKVRTHRTKPYAYGGGVSVPVEPYQSVMNPAPSPAWPGRALRGS